MYDLTLLINIQYFCLNIYIYNKNFKYPKLLKSHIKIKNPS